MKPQLKYGLLVGMAMFVTFLVNSILHLDGTTRGSIINYSKIIIIIYGIFFTIKETRDHAGFISFGRALGLGSLTCLISTLFNNTGKYIYHKFFHHQFFNDIRNLTIEKFETDSNLQQYRDQLPLMKKSLTLMISPGAFALASIILTFIVGFIISLILASLLKKDNTIPPMVEF